MESPEDIARANGCVFMDGRDPELGRFAICCHASFGVLVAGKHRTRKGARKIAAQRALAVIANAAELSRVALQPKDPQCQT